MPRMILRAAAVALLACLPALPALAQGAGRVEGRVASLDDQPLFGVAVSMPELGLQVTTAADGTFAFPAVPAGTWEIVAETAHARPARQTIEVTGGAVRRVTLELDPALAGVVSTIRVKARADSMVRMASAASEGVVGQIDLATRPLLRAGELVETIPGVVATQHSGGGKANQYFVRGFNLDHGTDFAGRVDSIPINMPSHGHGQGYLDLNFLIPELVETVSFRKGLVAARDGDFSAAGAVDFTLRDRLEESLVSFTGGEHGYARALALGSVEAGGGDLLGGIELSRYDGPWVVPGDSEKLNAVARYSRGGPTGGFRVGSLAYQATWVASDQIPRRALAFSDLSRFGSLDDTNGGSSGRMSLGAEAWRAGAAGFTRGAGYLVHYDLDLFSNFTYRLDDPVRGDQFEQVDERWMAGIDLAHERVDTWGRFEVLNRFGFQVRQDWIDNGLFRTAARRRLEPVRTDSIAQLAIGPHASSTIYWSPWLRTTTGLRADHYRVDVDSDDARNSGAANNFLVSPRLSAAFGPWGGTELYGSFGGGFHSNDARGATIGIDPATGAPAATVPLLVRGWGWEAGLRTEAVPGLSSTVAVFGLGLDSELVYVGDAGGTEAGRPSRRFGVELANFYSARPWLRLDLDLAFSRARFDDGDGADRIPGAMEKVVSAGIALDGWRRWSGSVRVRYFGSYPLIEDDSVRADPGRLVNARLAYLLPLGLEIGVEAFNLLDDSVNDIEYFYASRLAGEPAGGVEDVHFHPAEPRTIRVVATWRR